MSRLLLVVCLVPWLAAMYVPAAVAAGGIAVQQSSAVNDLYVIQERNLFHTHERTVTASTGRETATEIIAIGPDPGRLSVSQTGGTNRATIYQHGTSPNLDVQQSGSFNSVRSYQRTMP